MVGDPVVERFRSIMLRLDRSAVGWQSSGRASERLLIVGKAPYAVETSLLTSKCETDLNLLIRAVFEVAEEGDDWPRFAGPVLHQFSSPASAQLLALHRVAILLFRLVEAALAAA